jgi:hypothetical protein
MLVKTKEITRNTDLAAVRAKYGLTAEELPYGSVDYLNGIIDGLKIVGNRVLAAKAAKAAKAAPTGPLSVPEALDDAYDPSWLSPNERATIAGGSRDHDEPGTIGRLD